MSNVYRRYFKASSEAIISTTKLSIEVNARAREEYQEILKDLEVKDNTYWQDSNKKLIAFMPTKDLEKYRKVNHCKGFYPKQNTKFGKELHNRFQSVETIDPDNKIIELSGNPREIEQDFRLSMPGVVILPYDVPVVFITVPWYDEDPAVVDEYKKTKEEGVFSRNRIESLLWTPPEGFKEVKEWEVDKAVTTYNDSLKDK